jgi:hypothetical protein
MLELMKSLILSSENISEFHLIILGWSRSFGRPGHRRARRRRMDPSPVGQRIDKLIPDGKRRQVRSAIGRSTTDYRNRFRNWDWRRRRRTLPRFRRRRGFSGSDTRSVETDSVRFDPISPIFFDYFRFKLGLRSERGFSEFFFVLARYRSVRLSRVFFKQTGRTAARRRTG